MYTLKAENRDETLKAKQLRKKGKIPASIYSADHKDSIQIQMDAVEVTKLLHSCTKGSELTLELNGESKDVLLKDVTYGAVDHKVEDMNFQALIADEAIKTTAKIVILHADKAAGLADQVLYEIPYKARPASMVHTVEVDVSGMKAGEVVHLADLPLAKDANVRLLIAADSTVVHIVEPKVVEEEPSADAATPAEAAPADAAKAK